MKIVPVAIIVASLNMVPTVVVTASLMIIGKCRRNKNC
jgi:hypothetical protein